MTIDELIREAHKTAQEKGWWSVDDRPVLMQLPEKIALMHSELSEALEEYRAGRSTYWETSEGKPEGIGIELADCIIRIADYCGASGVDLTRMITKKLDYNRTRPFRHGGKVV